MKSKLATMTRMMTRGALAIALVVVCGGFELFRSENEDVIKGNRLLESGSEADLQAAIDAYRRAQRQLPDERGIDLNLGIALGKKGDFKKGAEHLEIAAGSHSPAVRAQALYVAGNLHFRAAEKVKEPKSPDEAKLRMEELAAAMSAYRRSLETQLKHPLETRLGTLTGDTRWNLELTLREMKKDEEKRQQQQQQQQNGQNGQNQQQQNGQNGQNGQQQNGQNGQNQQQNGQNGQNGQNQQQNGQNGQNGQNQNGQNGQQQNGQNGQNGQQNQNQNGQNGQNGQQQNGQNGQNGQQNGQQQQNGQNGQNQQNGQNGQNGQNQQQNGQNGTGQNGQNGQAGGPCDPSKEICGSNPGDALLDALERTEKNLALERARQRPGLRRKPVKDW